MRIKRLPISQVKFRHHPTLSEITCHDHFSLSAPVDIQRLPLPIAQTLLDLSPVLACKNQDEGVDWLLSPNPTLELLKHHPEQQKLYVSIHYTPAELVDESITASLFFASALSYREHGKLLSNLSHRIQQAKPLLKHTPAKKQLAQWAKVKPSAIRHIKECNG